MTLFRFGTLNLFFNKMNDKGASSTRFSLYIHLFATNSQSNPQISLDFDEIVFKKVLLQADHISCIHSSIKNMHTFKFELI